MKTCALLKTRCKEADVDTEHPTHQENNKVSWTMIFIPFAIRVVLYLACDDVTIKTVS